MKSKDENGEYSSASDDNDANFNKDEYMTFSA